MALHAASSRITAAPSKPPKNVDFLERLAVNRWQARCLAANRNSTRNGTRMTPAEITRAIKACTTETVLRDSTGERGSGVLMLVIRRYGTGVTAMWTAMWQQDGKRRKLQLGRYPDLSLADARVAFNAKVRDVLAAKKNPAAVAVTMERPTIQRLFTAYCDQMKADGKRSADEHRRCLDLAAAAIGANRLAGAIDPADISAYLGKLYAAGTRSAADHVRSYLSAAFGFGMKAAHDYRQEVRQDWGIKFNPVAAVPKDMNASKPGDRALTAAEIRQLWQLGTGFGFYTGAVVRLLICTGQRVEELLRVEAHEVDLDAMVWRMPMHKTKTQQAPHDVPLPALAAPLFRQLLAVHKRGFLFDGMDHRAVNRAIGRWLKTAKMPHFTTRDLRRTWKSRAGDGAGVTKELRDLIQQHGRGDTSSVFYDRAVYGPQMRAAMDAWNTWLASVLAEQPRGALSQHSAVQAQAQA